MNLSKGTERIFWSIAFPGFGQILNKQIFKGIIFIFLEFLINVKARLNLGLGYSFLGNTESAVKFVDYQWIMFYPCIYMFAMWDAYKNAGGDNSSFEFLPFAVAAIFSTISVMISPVLRVFGFLLGPVWLPILGILFGTASGLVVRRLLINYLKRKTSQTEIKSQSSSSVSKEESFEDRYPYITQLCKSELTGVAVYSVPDLMLVKANQTYLNFLDSPYNEMSNSIGRRINEIVSDWEGSLAEQYWREGIKTSKSFRVNEYMHKQHCRGISYWDSIVTPVMENGEVKYLVSNAQDVTERVISRKKVEEQMEVISSKNKQLEAIIESTGDILMIMDKDGKILKQSSAYSKAYGKSDRSTAENYDFQNNPLMPEDEPAYKVLKNGERVKDFKMKKVEDGNVTYVVTNGVPVFNSKEEVELGVFTTVVMTEAEGKGISL